MQNFPYTETLVGSKITNIKRICDLVMFDFELEDGEKLYLHIQCLIRLFSSDGILVISSPNMSDRSPNYRKKWFKKYDWTAPGSTVFDDAINDYKDCIFQTKVSKIKFDSGDLRLVFDNQMRMDVFVTVSKYDNEDYTENYRVFSDDKTKDHFII